MSKLATRADVIACYQNLLKRAPESEASIQWHLAQGRTFWELVWHFVEGKEFKEANRPQKPFLIHRFLNEPYLAAAFSQIQKYQCFSTNYLYLNHFVSAEVLDGLFGKHVGLFGTTSADVAYRIELTFNEGSTTEGEICLRFEAGDQTLFAIEFTIVPGALVGAAERHVILISHMQGWAGTHGQQQAATKAMRDIAPQAALFAAVLGIADALKISVITGVSARNQVCFDEGKAALFEGAYDAFFRSIGASGPVDGFYHYRVLAPEVAKPMATAGHRRRTRLRRKVKQEISEQVRRAWLDLAGVQGDVSPETIPDFVGPIAPAMGRPPAATAVTRRMALDCAEGRALSEAALGATARGDTDTALDMAARLRGRFPDDPSGYRIGAAAARGAGRLADAQAILSEAEARFANTAWILAESAWIARASGDMVRAADLSAQLRARFPDEPAGYQIGLAAALDLGRFDEVAALAAAPAARLSTAAATA